MPKKPLTLGPTERTGRGFKVVHFKDRYGAQCSLQASSLAVYAKPGTSAVWLGPDNADPKVMASQASLFGIKLPDTPEAHNGWVTFPIPKEVLMTTRMHLDREQVEALIGHLQRWLDKDTF